MEIKIPIVLDAPSISILGNKSIRYDPLSKDQSFGSDVAQ